MRERTASRIPQICEDVTYGSSDAIKILLDYMAMCCWQNYEIQSLLIDIQYAVHNPNQRFLITQTESIPRLDEADPGEDIEYFPQGSLMKEYIQ